MRRILRIWPLYFFFVGVTLCASRFTPVQFPTGAVLPMFMFYGNWWLMTHPFFSPAGILWSVSIEEQFYLLCPLAVRLLSKRGLVALCAALIGAAWVARLAILGYTEIKPSALWYCTFTRLDPIALGMLMALVLRGRVLTAQFPVRILLGLSGSFCMFAAATWLHGQDENLSMLDGMLSYPLADAGALLIFLSCLGASIAWRPAVYLGHISYGLYVYHLLALNIAKAGLLHSIGVCPFWLRGAIALPLTVGMAALSYAWLEAPFLRLKNRFGASRTGGVPAAPA
jgi:peptidoglycan/LPS O-acetylase OafA/YrhL